MIPCLLLVDIQNDFLPGGALAVPEGNKILPAVHQLLALPFSFIVATKDFHPPRHCSFATSSAKGLWPPHCIQGTTGEMLEASISLEKIDHIVEKGTDIDIDSYSAFFDNDRLKSTELETFLKGKNITRIAICGLATDYCVLWTVLDALSLGFEVDVILNACRGIDRHPGDIDLALEKMEEAGARLFNDVISYRDCVFL